MIYLTFSSLYVAKMTINNVFSLFKTTIELSEPKKSELGPIVIAALVRFTNDNDKLGLQINRNQKSSLTEELVPINKDRENVHAEIKRNVSTFLKSSNESKRGAAKALKSFFVPYWYAVNLPLNSQSGILSELTEKFKSKPELLAAAEILGIDHLFVALEVKNNSFDRLYKSRNEEYSLRGISGSSLKPVAVASYILFCTAMEQAVNLTPNEATLSLFYQLDELRKKYHALGGNGKTDIPPVVK